MRSPTGVVHVVAVRLAGLALAEPMLTLAAWTGLEKSTLTLWRTSVSRTESKTQATGFLGLGSQLKKPPPLVSTVLPPPPPPVHCFSSDSDSGSYSWTLYTFMLR